MSINEVQMSADVGLGGANLQFLDDAAGTAVIYFWLPKANCETYSIVCPEGMNGVWAVRYKSGLKNAYRLPNGDDAEPNKIVVSYGLQVNAVEGNTINFAGQVGEETITDMTRPARGNFNYIGNPFSADISINNIQMSDDVGLGGANLQFLDDAAGTAVIYFWLPKANCETYSIVCPEGLDGVWAVRFKSGLKNSYRLPNGDEAEPNVVPSGSAIQINAVEGNSMKVLCPYDL